MSHFLIYKLHIRYGILGLLTLISTLSWAQTSPPKAGKVLDAQTKQALSFATVLFYSPTTDSLLAGVQTNETGQFVIPKLPMNQVNLRISYVGYQPYQQRIDDLQAPVTVYLTPNANALKEVTVTAQKNDLTLTPEKRVFDVTKNLTATGGTAENLLKNVPSLTLDESGNASLRNMATTIYVNGKPTQLTLAQIPANQIESVEVISNPSARYDASTSGGIVNFILKKNRQPGYNGIVSVGLGNNHRYDGMVNLDWYRGKWNLSAFYNFNATQNPLNGYVHRQNKNPDHYFNQNTLTQLNNRFQNARISIEYALNPKNTFSLAGTAVNGAFNLNTEQTYQYLNASQQLTSYGSRRTTPHNNFTNTGLELDWKHAFARKGQSLSWINSFTHNQLSNAADWYTDAFDADDRPQVGYPERDQISGRTSGNQFISQLDYVHPFNDSTKLEVGLRHYSFLRDQTYFFNRQNTDGNSYTLIPDFSQDARISERVNAVYALYSTKFKRNVQFQAGLRFEQSQLSGRSRLDSNSFGYNYPTRQHWFQSLFPSFSLSKTWANSELNLSLSRKIGRPNFKHLFVGIQANDRQNITIGNPKVQPEFVNTAELNYTRSWNGIQWLSTAYYIYEDHTIKPFIQPSATDSTVLVTTFINVKADIRYGLDETLQFSMGKNLSLMASVNAYNVILQAPGLHNQLWTYNAKMNVTYRFPHQFSAQITVNRESRSAQLQGFRLGYQSADLALRKSFMQNRASVTFAINDVFNSRQYVTQFQQPDLTQLTMNRREVRFYKLSVQLPLGKGESRKKERKLERPDVEFGN